MADKRAYFKMDVGYFDNPKVADLVDDNPRAVLLHLRAIAYCAQHLTDGVFPMRLVMRLACGSHSDLQWLVDRGLIVRLDDANGLVHDYLEHQRSAESVKKAKVAGQAGAVARWDANRNADRNADRNAAPNAAPNANPNAEREREREREIPSPSAFDEFWSAYPRKLDKGKARKAWGAAIKKTEPSVIIEAAKRYAQSPDAKREGGKYLKYPATWLNAEAWENESATVTPLPTTRRTPEQILDGWMYQ